MKPASRRPVAAWGALLGGVLFTSASAVIIRFTESHPLVTAFWRMFIAAALSWPLTRRAGRKGRYERPASDRRAPRHRLLVAASGVLLAAHFAVWISAVRLTSVAHATVLVTTHPILVLLGTRAIEGRRPTQRRLIATCVAVGGAVLLAVSGTSGGRSPTAIGNLLAFLGAVFFAAYLLIGGIVRRSLDTASYTARIYTIAAAVLIVPALAAPGWIAAFPGSDLLMFILLAVVCTLLGHSVFNWALTRIDARDVSAVILLEPVLATLAALALFGEVPGPGTLAGGIIVIMALFFVVASPGRVGAR